jgi:hypothetical protein
MISAMLKFIHVVSGAIAIGAGAWVLFGVLEGKLFKKWAVIFLKCALVASATGLLFPFHHFLPTHWVAMSTVYVSVVAVLAWRIYGLAGIGALLFALSAAFVWCLDVLVVIAHVFEMLIPTQHKLLLIIMESIVVLLFAGSGLFIVKRYRDSQVERMARIR